jgi:type 1 fimbria pilin
MRTIRLWAALAAVAVAIALVGPGLLVSAASGTPTATTKIAAAGHPVHIHDGTCAKLGAVVYPLTDLIAPVMTASATKAATPAKAGTPVAAMKEVVAESTTKVKVSLKDLEAKPFAINAHESMAKITNYIACGDIKGTITKGKLTVALTQLNKSGLEGDAVLTDNGDGTTTVVIQLSKASGS